MLAKFAAQVGRPRPRRSLHAGLAGEAEQSGHIVEARAAAPLEAGEDVHEVHVPPVKPAQVIAVAKTRVAVAGLPVARGRHAVQQASVMQHRQIETRAVPGHQIGREFIESLEEAFDQLLFRGFLVAEAPELERIARPHDDGDRDDPVLFVRQEIRRRPPDGVW